MEKLNEIVEERLVPIEDEELSLYEQQLEMLEKDCELKCKIGFAKKEPEMVYETDPEYLEFQKEQYRLSIAFEKLRTKNQINRILNNKDQRRLEKQRLKEMS